MLDEWITVRRIVCLRPDDDAEIIVLRLLRTRHTVGQKRHRYILEDGARVVVARDSKLRIAGTKTLLQPVLVLH